MNEKDREEFLRQHNLTPEGGRLLRDTINSLSRPTPLWVAAVAIGMTTRSAEGGDAPGIVISKAITSAIGILASNFSLTEKEADQFVQIVSLLSGGRITVVNAASDLEGIEDGVGIQMSVDANTFEAKIEGLTLEETAGRVERSSAVRNLIDSLGRNPEADA